MGDTPVAGESAEMPPVWFGVVTCCWSLKPGYFLPCPPRKRAYSKEAVYSDKLQHYSTGRGERGTAGGKRSKTCTQRVPHSSTIKRARLGGQKPHGADGEGL